MAIDNIARSSSNNITPEKLSTTNEMINGYVLSNDGTDLAWVNPTGGLNPLGSWDASTNTPTLTSGVGTSGDFYVVSVAGNTELDGISTWNIGDQVLFGNGAWNRIENVSTALPPEIITTSQSVTNFDISYVVNTSVADITITIPDADATNGGQRLQVINNSGSFNVIVQTTSGQNIGSDVSQTIENNDEAISVTSYGNSSGYIITQDSRFNATIWGEIEGDLTSQTDLANELAKTYIIVDDITARDAIPAELLTEGKIVLVEDIGDGTDEMYRWTGITWEINNFDSVRISDGGKIQSENGGIEMIFTETGDDAGVCIKGGQLEVGTPDDPKESVFGGGDSYPVPVAFHCDTANTSGLTITGAIDVTTILESDNGSTTGLFGGVSIGSYILVGSDYPFAGGKVKVDTAGIFEPEDIVAEYLFNSSPTWINTFFMSTLSGFPYTSYANDLSGLDGTSFQWRFGFDPDNLPTPWNQVTLNINGINYTKYWGRFRVVSTLSQDIVVEQIKLHTNRFEINDDGTTEYFGRARYKKTLVFGMESITRNSLKSPSNQTVEYGADLTAGYQYNRFANNAEDGFAIIQNITEGMDTSIPLEITVSFYVDGTQTGDVELRAEVFQVSDGFVYDGNNIPETYSAINQITTPSDLIRTTSKFNVSVNKLSPPDAIIVNIFRDATVSNPNDTIQQAIVVTNVALAGYFWRP